MENELNIIRKKKKSPKEITSSLDKSIKTSYKWQTKYDYYEEDGQELTENVKYEKLELQDKMCQFDGMRSYKLRYVQINAFNKGVSLMA